MNGGLEKNQDKCYVIFYGELRLSLRAVIWIRKKGIYFKLQNYIKHLDRKSRKYGVPKWF